MVNSAIQEGARLPRLGQSHQNIAEPAFHTVGRDIVALDQRKFFATRAFVMTEGGPMPTQCNEDSFAFGRVEGRKVVATFDGRVKVGE